VSVRVLGVLRWTKRLKDGRGGNWDIDFFL